MTPEFEETFAALRTVLQKHKRTFKILKDEPREYSLVTKSNSHKGGPMWFASVRVGKAYVSYHLLALYLHPAMNAKVPPALKNRMQGKACFNFKKPDPELLAELKTLTQAAVDYYRTKELL